MHSYTTTLLALLAARASAGKTCDKGEKLRREDGDARLITFKAAEWSGGAGKKKGVDPFDDEQMIEIDRDHNVVSFTNGGGGGPYRFQGELSFPLALTTPDGEPLTLDMEGERLKVSFGYDIPAEVLYERRGCGCRCSERDGIFCQNKRKKQRWVKTLEGQTCSTIWTDCHGCYSTGGYCGTPSGRLGEEGGFRGKVYCGDESCPAGGEDVPDFVVIVEPELPVEEKEPVEELHYEYNDEQRPVAENHRDDEVAENHHLPREYDQLEAAAAATPLADLEGVAWFAVSWTGAAREGGDPDPLWDEQLVQFEGSTISFPNGGGGGPYTVTEDALPVAVSSPDGEPITFRMIPSGHLVVDFGYSRPASIVYERRAWSEVDKEESPEHSAAKSSCLLVAGVLLLFAFAVGLAVGAYCKRRRALAPMMPVEGVLVDSKKVADEESTVIVVDDSAPAKSAPVHAFTNCAGEPLKRCDLGASCPYKHQSHHAASYYHEDAPAAAIAEVPKEEEASI